ncbi:hypothetical protein BDQ12DRAFT_224850 [Crucibulum laeve]|uniref:ATP-dependent DNA helicase n=1 Tax=Crucibulum laeve TaxID=68775 RepID=A0A5C3LXE7_9AGAR|nr:hypothetical protein BDQ12DRAFT_224850 [Crucibulum laeve]
MFSSPDPQVQATPTGIAGLNIGGSTIHAWGGIGLGKEPADVLADRIEFSPRLSSRWRGVKVLVIDEISMLDGTLFDKLEYIARAVRKSSEPFAIGTRCLLHSHLTP